MSVRLSDLLTFQLVWVDFGKKQLVGETSLTVKQLLAESTHILLLFADVINYFGQL